MTAEIDPLFVELQGVLAGRYSLERELGRGGMGIVYLARDVGLDRLVAIKLLPPDLAAKAQLRERFLREARTAARLSHPNIVPIHAVEESGKLVWFVMAYVPGESLGQRIKNGGALAPAEASRVIRDVAWALGHAHAQGVVHRDVKPDNVLLEAGTRRALIADFGIAAPALRQADSEGGVVGTVGYLSPEQARGDAVDGRSDIYALGVVGYCTLASRLPYSAATLQDLVSQHMAGPPAQLASVAPHVPRALCRTIDRCLSHYPNARFQTAEQLAEALDQLSVAPAELPVPLRVWLSKGVDARRALGLWSVLWGIPSFFTIIGMVISGFPGLAPFLITFSAMLGVPVLIYGGARVFQTRKVLAAGYAPSDLILAIRAQADRRREELAFEIGKPPSKFGRFLRRLTWTAFGLALLSPFGLFRYGIVPPLFAYAWIAVAGTALGGAFLGMLVPGREIPAKDLWSSLQEKFWTGRVGKLLTKLAGWRLGRRGAPEFTLHRPTEVALGEAAEALYKALPSAQRKDLKHLPQEIQFLSTQAQEMRRKLEELDDLIASAAPDTLFGEKSTAGGDGGAAELKEARDIWAARLKETVTLLESLRVGLLKLHAGTAVPDQLTSDLEAAVELRERLKLLAEAHSDIESK